MIISEDFTSAKPCLCMEKKKIERMFKSSHITEEFQKLGFQNFHTENRPASVLHAKESALAYLKHFEEIRGERQNSIALLGPPGSGKTHLLMAISNNLMRKGIPAMYFPYVEGFNDIKDDLDQLETKIGAMKRVDVLYIDDLYKGRKSPTDFMIEQLFAVVNFRYLNHMPIMVSSERDIDGICQVDMAIGSRIYEMSKRYTVLLGVEDTEKEAGIELNYRLVD